MNVYDLEDYNWELLNEANAVKHWEDTLWSNGVICPHCKSVRKHWRYKSNKKGFVGRLWKCADCRKQFTVTVGTPFERTRVPIKKWVMAFYLINKSDSGKEVISALQMSKMLSLTYKTTWKMYQIIKKIPQGNTTWDMLCAAILLISKEEKKDSEVLDRAVTIIREMKTEKLGIYEHHPNPQSPPIP